MTSALPAPEPVSGRATALPDPAGAAEHVVEVGAGAGPLGGLIAERGAQPLLEVGGGAIAGHRASRSFASARLACDFTVPAETPRVWAISASLRSS